MFFRKCLLAIAGGILVTASAHATVYAVGCNGIYSLYDAINAAVADPDGPHLIKLPNSHNYILSQEDIVDPAADITIEGGYQNCSDAQPVAGQYSTLTNNTPAATTRLLYLSNALANPRRSITLRHLHLTGGSLPGNVLGGGAIYAQYNLDLNLDDVQIDHNSAENGGGISLLNLSTNSATQTVLHISDNTRISDNQATGTSNTNGNGGGIYAYGAVHIVFADGHVQGNSARRAGGGIAVRSTSARLDFEPAPGNVIYIDGNTAGRATFASNEGFGGGVYSENANIGTSIAGVRNAFQMYFLTNTANYGGAIYVQGDPAASAPFTFVSLRNALMYSNEALGKGGALYSSDAVDWNIDHQATGQCDFFGPVVCSLFLDNFADNTTTHGTPGGGAIYLTSEVGSQRGIARVKRTKFNGNSDPNGWVAVGAADNDNEFLVQRSIFVNNHAPTANYSVLLHASGPTHVYYSDMLANSVSALFDISGATLNVQGSIFANPAGQIWFHSFGATMVHNNCLLSNHAGDIPAGAQIGSPLLDGQYAPTVHSPALDSCNNSQHTPISDIYGHAVVDVPGIDNIHGANDLGAVEQTDIIFVGGFGTRPTD
ncbi:MAG: hypothetical protein WBW92_09080 [Rhodanobacteraceae bacterium]